MANLMTDGNDLIVAVVCTTYSPYVATFLGESVLGATTFNMNEQIASDPDLLGRWSLNEGSGTTAEDSSGNGNNVKRKISAPDSWPCVAYLANAKIGWCQRYRL